jgi:hypothetical protein
MKAYMELKVFQGYGILTMHILFSQSRDPRRGRSRCACVWKYLVANLTLLCSLKQVSLF